MPALPDAVRLQAEHTGTPAAAPDAIAPSAEAVRGGRSSRHPAHRQALILVVDDNDRNRDMLSRRLERQGYGVAVAENGRQAMEAVRAQAFDLVLLDIMMPEMDGYEVLQAAQSRRGAAPHPGHHDFGAGRMDSVVRCIEMGAEDYLPKPFDPTLLKARIGACLEKKRAHDREMRLFTSSCRKTTDGCRSWKSCATT